MRNAFFVLLALGLAEPGQAENPNEIETLIELEASSPWQVSYEDNLCRLSRLFGSEEGKHALVVEQLAPDQKVDLMVTGPSMAGFKPNLPGKIRLSESSTPIEAMFFGGTADGIGAAIVFEQLSLQSAPAAEDAAEKIPSPFGSGLDLEFADGIEQLAISQGSRAIVLKTGPMRDVLAVMNECTAHILTTWGLDPDKLANASRGVRLMDPQTLSRRILETYPTRALQNNEQGRVGVLVKIDEKGGVYDCEIVADSGSKSLNNAACNGMKRAKFEPALDVAGQPIKSYYSTRISYRLN